MFKLDFWMVCDTLNSMDDNRSKVLENGLPKPSDLFKTKGRPMKYHWSGVSTQPIGKVWILGFFAPDEKSAFIFVKRDQRNLATFVNHEAGRNAILAKWRLESFRRLDVRVLGEVPALEEKNALVGAVERLRAAGVKVLMGCSDNELQEFDRLKRRIVVLRQRIDVAIMALDGIIRMWEEKKDCPEPVVSCSLEEHDRGS